MAGWSYPAGQMPGGFSPSGWRPQRASFARSGEPELFQCSESEGAVTIVGVCRTKSKRLTNEPIHSIWDGEIGIAGNFLVARKPLGRSAIGASFRSREGTRGAVLSLNYVRIHSTLTLHRE